MVKIIRATRECVYKLPKFWNRIGVMQSLMAGSIFFTERVIYEDGEVQTNSRYWIA